MTLVELEIVHTSTKEMNAVWCMLLEGTEL